MRTTIDTAGRVVIPKVVREAAGLTAGSELDVEFRDGRTELEPAPVPMRLVRRGSARVVEADGELPPLSVEDVRDVLERVRR
jgi:AbrB family looped-hinge helix DNA binding protein